MYKHKSKCNVEIDGKVYKCNKKGVVLLPDVYEQFNPLERKPKKKAKKEED